MDLVRTENVLGQNVLPNKERCEMRVEIGNYVVKKRR